MRGIQILESHMIDKIAAGEVVDRPLSIVKELTENAIDAGATAITVEIENGGLSMIRVTDNGTGIPKEQVNTAFMRHATSKVRDAEDLAHIMTLGFRGEALSSIAAVSQVEIITKTEHDLTGVRMEIHGGQEMNCHELGCAGGTTVITRNLFFNTPVRLHFLKKPATEAGYISDIVNKLALGRPDIAFTYINNGTQLLRTSGNGDLKTAIFQVYGKEAAQSQIRMDFAKELIQLQGYIGKPETARSNRSYGNFFINGRFIKSELLQSAVEEGYKTMLPAGKFPIFVLHMRLRPDNVDVNVHPNKLDIRFKDEKNVFLYCVEAVEGALKENDLTPKWDRGSMRKKNEPLFFREDNEPPAIQGKLGDALLQKLYPPREAMAQEAAYEAAGHNAPSLEHIWEQPPDVTHPEEAYSTKEPSIDPSCTEGSNAASLTQQDTKRPFFNHYSVMGQAFQTYWVIEQDDSLYYIDQHAAHERILYEELMQAYKSQDIPAQHMLEPLVVQLSLSEKVTVMDNMELLHGFGFDIEDFGEQALLVRAVPFIFKGPAGKAVFLELVDKLRKVNTSVANLYDIKLNAIATVACKAAVKAHDKLTTQEARALIEKILTVENPFTCPHGRPTIIRMTKYELEKKFKRV